MIIESALTRAPTSPARALARPQVEQDRAEELERTTERLDTLASEVTQTKRAVALSAAALLRRAMQPGRGYVTSQWCSG